MASSLQTLIKILRLEQQKEYQDRAVIGGLGRFAYHWAKEAHAQAQSDSQHSTVDTISGMLRDYASVAVDERSRLIEEVIALAQGQQRETPAESATRNAIAEPVIGQAESVGVHKLDMPLGAPSAPEPLATLPIGTGETAVAAAPVSVRERRGYSLQEAEILSDELQRHLNAPLSSIRNVGDKRAKLLEKIGARTIGDILLSTFPRRHDDFSRMKIIRQLKIGEEVAVIGTLTRIQAIRTKQGTLRVEAYLEDDSGAIRLNWFNQPWMEKKLQDGAHVVASGKIEQYLGRMVMNAPEIELLDSEWLQAGQIVPVYPLTKGLYGRFMRRLAKHIVSTYTPRLPDYLPIEVREHADLMDYGDAIAQAHFPDSQEDLGAAQMRLAFDEIFLLHLRMLRQRRQWQRRKGIALPVDDGWLAAFTSRLPYHLTTAQERAIQDIRRDLAGDIPMNRLLQGDVGSGKTVVAAVAMGMAVANGTQAALMAPTSILAEQHYHRLSEIYAAVPLNNSPRIALLTSQTTQADRAAVYSGLSDGSVQIVVGTHAVIQPDIAFARLGLAVIDEQHRFGVIQRAALREKAAGGNPHLLVMTATPIPRTLALTVHADLDLTVIDEMPPGRASIQTRVLQPKERERGYAFVRGQVQKGRQAFIIYPIIEESEKLAARAAIAEHKRLQEKIFPDFKVGLLHGRMRADEKEAVMDGFYRGDVPILVSTSVIEVGIDVPNATVMMVENANRFGLAQLHQLRGRVGRGEYESYCLLVSDHNFLDGDERLHALEEHTDGFELARIDWEIRGAGDLLGVRQSGLTRLKHADLMDSRLIDHVRREARALIEQDADLSQPAHQPLRQKLRPHKHEGDIS